MSLCQKTRAQNPDFTYYNDPSYSGGEVTYDGPPSTQVPYAQLRGGGLDYGFEGSGANNCSGQITTTFTWAPPAYAPGPPPQTVIVAETADTYWMDFGGTGSCDDGLGDPAVGSISTPSPSNPNPQNYATSTGTHFFVGSSTSSGPVTVNSGTVTVKCTPTASTPAGGPECIVGYSAYVYPLTISVGGATPDTSGNEDILIGQQCTPSLNSTRQTVPTLRTAL